MRRKYFICEQDVTAPRLRKRDGEDREKNKLCFRKCIHSARVKVFFFRAANDYVGTSIGLSPKNHEPNRCTEQRRLLIGFDQSKKSFPIFTCLAVNISRNYGPVACLLLWEFCVVFLFLRSPYFTWNRDGVEKSSRLFAVVDCWFLVT